jgi:organic radical activating enzyme
VKTLRLLLFSACTRDCDLCCNKDWDLDALPIERDFTSYDEVLLTGGEPMLSPRRIREATARIRTQTARPRVYLYTAMVHRELFALLEECLDGVTLTLHEQSDVTLLAREFLRVAPTVVPSKSLRLNVFEGVALPDDLDLMGWVVKRDMVWLPNCPLPANETFCRIEWEDCTCSA